VEWTGRHDYGEREDDSGDYLGNAIVSGVAATEILRRFGTPQGLVRSSGDSDSGLDSAAAWAVRPFARPGLNSSVRRTLLALAAEADPFGISPAKPLAGAWTAPTAWSAWSLAALEERSAADRLLRSLRRASTPAGMLPERVELPTGIPISATPLAWSHAFAILALRERYR
jgi:GH15 family glucan-1,4-alpha-glucosidase